MSSISGDTIENAAEGDGAGHTGSDQKTSGPVVVSGAATTTSAVSKKDLNDDGSPKDVRLRCFFYNKCFQVSLASCKLQALTFTIHEFFEMRSTRGLMVISLFLSVTIRNK